MKILTLQQLEDNFDDYLDKVEQSESYLIRNQNGDVVLTKKEDEDLLRMYRDHEEGC